MDLLPKKSGPWTSVGIRAAPPGDLAVQATPLPSPDLPPCIPAIREHSALLGVMPASFESSCTH